MADNGADRKLKELKELMSRMESVSRELTDLTGSGRFIPQQTCSETAELMKSISALQKDISDIAVSCGAEIPADIESAEKAVRSAEEKNRLIKAVRSVICGTDKYREILDKLISELENDPSELCTKTAEALISDLKSGNISALRYVEGIDDSRFSELILACMFGKLSLGSVADSDNDKPAESSEESSAPAENTAGSAEKEQAYPEYAEFIDSCELDFSMNTEEAVGAVTIEETAPHKELTVKKIENIIIAINNTHKDANIHQGTMLIYARHAMLSDAYSYAKANRDTEGRQPYTELIKAQYGKGLLRKLSLKGYPDIYTLSANGEKVFKTETLRKLLDYKGSKEPTAEMGYAKTGRGLKSFHMLLQFTSELADVCEDMLHTFGRCGINISKVGNPFIILCVNDNSKLFIYSFLPTSGEDIAAAAEEFIELINDSSGISFVIISSDVSYSLALCGLIAEKYSGENSYGLYIFSCG